MNAEYVISQLDRNHGIFQKLLEVHEFQLITWKPAADKWCLVEVVCHLYDEEREDFRLRVDSALHRSGEEWPPIDPSGWVMDRKYLEQDYFEKVQAFLHERQKSVHWKFQSCKLGIRQPFQLFNDLL